MSHPFALTRTVVPHLCNYSVVLCRRAVLQYVADLAVQADAALAAVPADQAAAVAAAAEAAVRRVAELEVGFWAMAFHVDSK